MLLEPTNCLVPLPNAMAEAATFWPHAHSVTPYDDTESKAAHTKDVAVVLCPLHGTLFCVRPTLLQEWVISLYDISV